MNVNGQRMGAKKATHPHGAWHCFDRVRPADQVEWTGSSSIHWRDVRAVMICYK